MIEISLIGLKECSAKRMGIINKFIKVTMICVYVTFFSNLRLYSQDYRYPLSVPMSLSGNYGELRGNHFHGGIDFRIGGVSGAPVYATDNGYISRISVSPTGYGNALYITHDNGYVSVYGHLHAFRDDIAKLVRESQYLDEEFKQDLHLESTQFPVKKGDFIANAGNTGSSGGPHLHFEIRDENNLQTDVFARKYININDKTPPLINSVAFYSYDIENVVPQTLLITQRTTNDKVINVPKNFYVAIDSYDKQEGTSAKLAVSDYKVFYNDSLIFHFNLNEVPLSKNKYINSLIEYERLKNRGRAMVKSYVEPGNVLSFTNISSSNNGIISLQNYKENKVRVEVSDIMKNKSSKTFRVKRSDDIISNLYPNRDTLRDNFMAWFTPGFFKNDYLNITLPLCALYNSIYLRVDSLQNRVFPFSPVWKIHYPQVPLHYPIDLEMKTDIPDTLAMNACFVLISPSGRASYAGGNYDVGKGVMKGKIYSFGNYSVGVDITPPTITPSFNNNAIIKSNFISFTIKDNLSGIKKYRVEIDGNWVLAEYDAKRNKLYVPLLHSQIKRGVKHTLTIKVWDNLNNERTLKRSFTW